MMFDIKNSKNVVLEDNKNKGSNFALIDNVESFSAKNNISESKAEIKVPGWRKLISNIFLPLLGSILVLVITYYVYLYFPEIKKVMI